MAVRWPDWRRKPSPDRPAWADKVPPWARGLPEMWQKIAAGEAGPFSIIKLVTPDDYGPEEPLLTAEDIRERRREKLKQERREKRQKRRRKRSKASPHPDTPSVDPDAAEAKPELTEAQRIRLEAIGGSVLEDGSIWIPASACEHLSGPNATGLPSRRSLIY